jgi:hypothetical protein
VCLRGLCYPCRDITLGIWSPTGTRHETPAQQETTLSQHAGIVQLIAARVPGRQSIGKRSDSKNKSVYYDSTTRKALGSFLVSDEDKTNKKNQNSSTCLYENLNE